MTTFPLALDDLDRPTLVRAAHEYMLTGMLVNRSMLPQVVLHTGGLDEMDQVAIDLWMGASPVYTHRMRRLMGIEGDDIAAIMKALQLDVGFVHQYMDVAYRIIDEHHGEFWLNHCGALLDAEPHGDDRVFGMCHTIEDPTFDATALATNPRARIRPIHRPPREPADRHPHCHWTITIDPANEPVGPARFTRQVADLPLAAVANERARAANDGLVDYAGSFVPDLRLADLASPTLAAAGREFQMQTHLLVCSGQLTLAERFGADAGREMTAVTWQGAAWLISERLDAALGPVEDPARRVARVLALSPALPPGFERRVEVDGDSVRLSLTSSTAGLSDPAHPGAPGLLARGDDRLVAALVHAADPTARVSGTVADGGVQIDVEVGGSDPVAEPDIVGLMRMSLVAGWHFDTTDLRRRS